MRRALFSLLVILLALLGAWWVWPRPGACGPLAQQQPTPTEPASRARPGISLDSADPTSARAAAGAPRADPSTAPASPAAAELVVRCLARGTNETLAGVRVYACYAGSSSGYGRVGTGRAASGAPGEELLSAPDGRARFHVQAGRALRVSADDLPHFVSQEGAELAALAPGETRELVLEHDAGEHAHFCGLVVAREDGTPLGQAQVSVEGVPRTRTDAAGRFELDYAAHLPPWIRVDAQGFAPALASASPGHPTRELARRIELLRPASLEIALAGAGDQARLRVELRGEARELAEEAPFTSPWHRPQALVLQADADASGVCRFTDLPPHVGFDARAIGSSGVLQHALEPFVLQPGETRRIEWDLGGTTIVGKVVESDGRPAAGVALVLLPGATQLRYVDPRPSESEVLARATSAADGSFRMTRLAPGERLLAPLPTQDIAGVPQELVIAPGQREVAVEVRLARGIFVRGRLLAPDGESGVRGYVSFCGEVNGGTNTQLDGSFVLGPLVPGRIQISAFPNEPYRSDEAVLVDPPAENVLLRTSLGAELSGRVVDELGSGVEAVVTGLRAAGGWWRTRSRPDGSFDFRGLRADRYTLFASASDGRAGLLENVTLATAQPISDQQIVLHAGALLRVRSEGNAPGALRLFRDGTCFCGESLEPGRSVTLVVLPGRLRAELAADDGGQPPAQELELAAGETREVVFPAPPK